jgi:chemotaxis protein CheD
MSAAKPKFVLEVFLQPGEWHFGDADTRIRTLLGSCVSITLWHPSRRIGGMCHYMLPRRGGRAGAGLDGRYADEAVRLLMQEMMRAKTRPDEYDVKLFGGGDMFPQLKAHGRNGDNIARQNIDAGRRLLQQHGFRIKTEQVGGVGQRHAIFDVWSGHVWVRRDKALAAGGAHD